MNRIAIIGGGIIGMLCAYKLNEKGQDVTIIDRGNFSDGCSYGNAGMIVPSHFIPMASPAIISKGIQWMMQKKSPFYIKPRFDLDLLKWLWHFDRSSTEKHVNDSAPLLHDLHMESREFYSNLNNQPDFDFNYENKGILMLYQTEEVEEEEEATADMAFSLGIEARKLSHNEVQALEKQVKVDVRGAIYYPGDAHLHPQKLMIQLRTYLESRGVEFLPNTEVIDINGLDSNQCELTFAKGFTKRFAKAIVAGGSWSARLLITRGIKLPMVDGKGYSMTYKGLNAIPSIPSILLEPRVAITPMDNSLRISGTLEISGMDDKIQNHKVKAILDAVPQYYPGLRFPSEKVWFGYRPCSADGLPYIGKLKNHPSVFVATGHAMMGLSLAPATARMLTDQIVNANPKPVHRKLDYSRFGR